MVLEVFVGNVAIAIDVEVPEDFKCLWLAAAESDILNFFEQATESAGLSLVLYLHSFDIAKLSIDESWRWVGSCSGVQSERQLVCISLKDKRCN